MIILCWLGLLFLLVCLITNLIMFYKALSIGAFEIAIISACGALLCGLALSGLFTMR